ncbi:MAG: B12-binding domain-containing radical SAM protein, partial [Gemmatimonadota bacterium]|nr:B12-binding domain-containing radical SAM protein [Gemmatimonadota bacterium]
METHKESFRPWMIPSCGLLTVAALEERDIEYVYIDEQVTTVDTTEPFDIVAFSGMTQHALGAYKIAEQFRSRGAYTVMGGPHATAIPEEVRRHVDTVIAGEAEGAWEKFLEDFRAGTPKPVYSNLLLDKTDINCSPTPRYDLLGSDYFSRGSGYKMVPVQTTRGCPRDCEFCSVPQVYGKSFRHKSVEQVLNEVRAARSVVGDELVLFADDNMFLNRRFSKELLERLVPERIRYMAQSDIGIAKDEDLLSLMHRSGCVMVLVGLESLSPENLNTVDQFKSRMLSKYREYVKRIQDHGMIVLGAFIVGLDHDDESVFERIADFVLETHITPQITIATPLPQTAMTQRWLEEGRLPKHSYWDHCTYYDAVYQPANMTSSELERGLADLHHMLFRSDIVAA